MQVHINPAPNEWNTLLKRPVIDFSEIESRVSPILAAVKTDGDAALRKFALDFDNILLNEFEVDLKEVEQIGSTISEELKQAIKVAFNNIHTFHKAQVKQPEYIETHPGVTCWRKQLPINKVGIYIPGGTAPLFSSVLMLGIPAVIAGCEEIVLCSPSNDPAIYYAAHLVGVTKVFRIGGAQAIAALAYGTASVPKVDKIFGPGNQYVTTAKQLVSKEGIAIDMPAGPSEVAVLADESANAAFIASDLLSQAEHGLDSQVLLITTSTDLVNEVQVELQRQLELLPRREFAESSLQNSKALVLPTMEDAIALVNQYAAEHLIIATNEADHHADQIKSAGSIFIGNYTPESCGDYASGTNHTLPTNGFASAYSGVSVDSYVKNVTYQKITKAGLRSLGPHVVVMANAEGLNGHANAVTLRLQED